MIKDFLTALLSEISKVQFNMIKALLVNFPGAYVSLGLNYAPFQTLDSLDKVIYALALDIFLVALSLLAVILARTISQYNIDYDTTLLSFVPFVSTVFYVFNADGASHALALLLFPVGAFLFLGGLLAILYLAARKSTRTGGGSLSSMVRKFNKKEFEKIPDEEK